MKISKNRLVHIFVIGIFLLLYLLVSIISTIHVVDFFHLSNNWGMSIFLAVAFEIGAAASLASIVVLEKMNRTIIWALFCILTAMQMMGNVYYAFVHLVDFQAWIQLFGLTDQDPIMQKRVLAIISGAILPLVALGFIKALVDYIRPSDKIKNIADETEEKIEKTILQKNIESAPEVESITEVKPPIEIETIESQPETIEKEVPKILDNIQDPKLRQDVDEYINKTKLDSGSHMKTTPGIG